jgi:hypothetical protein
MVAALKAKSASQSTDEAHRDSPRRYAAEAAHCRRCHGRPSTADGDPTDDDLGVADVGGAGAGKQSDGRKEPNRSSRQRGPSGQSGRVMSGADQLGPTRG